MITGGAVDCFQVFLCGWEGRFTRATSWPANINGIAPCWALSPHR